MTQPANPNFLSPLGFAFVLRRAPTVAFICQSVALPTLTLGEVIHPTPLHDVRVPSDKMLFEPVTIRFKVDEDMVNYFEIFDWMVGMATPESSQQYKDFTNIRTKYPPPEERLVFSDATLIVQTAAKNPNKTILFKNIFPISLSLPEFDITQTEVVEMTSDCTFVIESFSLDTES